MSDLKRVRTFVSIVLFCFTGVSIGDNSYINDRLKVEDKVLCDVSGVPTELSLWSLKHHKVEESGIDKEKFFARLNSHGMVPEDLGKWFDTAYILTVDGEKRTIWVGYIYGEDHSFGKIVCTDKENIFVVLLNQSSQTFVANLFAYSIDPTTQINVQFPLDYDIMRFESLPKPPSPVSKKSLKLVREWWPGKYWDCILQSVQMMSAPEGILMVGECYKPEPPIAIHYSSTKQWIILDLSPFPYFN